MNINVLERICRTLNCQIGDIVELKEDSENGKSKIRVVSLFSGIGGFELGINNSNLDCEVVFSSEIDKHATASYLANFKDNNLHGDY